MSGVTVVGVRGHLVAVEAHVGRGLPSLTLTGLPSTQVYPEDVYTLERLAGVHDPGPGAAREFLGGSVEGLVVPTLECGLRLVEG